MGIEKLNHCLNCQQELLHEENFCPNCGQKNHATRLTIKSFFQEAISSVFNLDSRLWTTLKVAFSKLGLLVKEFNQGQRKKYVAPVQFYLFCSVLYFLFLGIDLDMRGVNLKTDKMIRDKIEKSDSIPVSIGFNVFKLSKLELKAIPNFNDQQIDSLLHLKQVPVNKFNRVMVQRGVDIILNGPSGVAKKIYSLLSTSMFFLMPIFAWLLYLFFAKIYPFYIEHLIFSIYFHSIAFIVFTCGLLLQYLPLGQFTNPLLYIGLFGYTLFSIKHFYELNWIKTILYTIGMSILYGIILALFMIVISLIGILMF